MAVRGEGTQLHACGSAWLHAIVSPITMCLVPPCSLQLFFSVSSNIVKLK